MGIEAGNPWALLLLLPWLILIWRMAIGTPRLTGFRKKAAIAIRAVIMLLLIAIAAQLYPYKAIEQRAVVFVADRSSSMGGDGTAAAWIAEAWEGRSEDDYGAIVSTAQSAVVDRQLTNEPLPFSRSYSFRTELSKGHTDLSKGLQLGAALLAERGGGRLLLLSDGAQNAGDILRSARLLKDAGIALDVVPLVPEPKRDAAIEELTVPTALKQGETFSFEIMINSTYSGSAELRLFADDKQLSISELQLERGENRFALQSVALDPGFHRFRAELYAQGDEVQANNAAHAFSRVGGPPLVLIVEGEPGISGNLEAALTSSFIMHQTIAPERLSQELTEYAAYDSIILNNVPATRIAEKPMEWLGKATRDYGVGLMMLGGGDSFGLGGYFKTPVERALPVHMELQGNKKIPSLGLVLVIDRSGSMSDGKLELAKEAAMRTIELLRDEDTVGIVAFDSSPWWVVPPTKLNNRDEVLTAIQGIQPEGGTDIFSGLLAGYEVLKEVDAQRKHIILLTDGQSAGGNQYDRITDGMKEDMMTLSTVAVGDDADQILMQRLAENGGGRYYFTRDQSTLPAIFSRETVLMSRTYIVDGTFVPQIGQAGGWGSLWADGVPSVNAYVATSPKELAEVALWTPERDPLLARWTYGSGRTVAWMSDASGRWAPEWTGWAKFPDVFAELVKWTFPQFDSSPYRVTVMREGSGSKLVVESGGGQTPFEDNAELAAIIQQEEGDEGALRLMPVAPGRYEAQLQSAEPGAYLAQIGRAASDGESLSVEGGATAGYVIPYSPEYRIGNNEGTELLRQAAQITGGRMLDGNSAADAYRFEPQQWREPYRWTRQLLIAALLLWLLDIAVRRLSIPWRRMASAVLAPLGKLAAGRRRGSTAEPRAAAEALDRLRTRTAASKRFYGEGRAGHTSQPESSPPRSQEASGSAEANPQSRSMPADSKRQSGSVQSETKPSSSQTASGKRNTPAAPAKQADTPAKTGEKQGAGDASTVNRLLAAKNKNKR